MCPNCLSPFSACVGGHVSLPLLSAPPHCLQLPLSLDPPGPRPSALPLSSPHISLPGQQGSEARVIRVSIDNDHGNLYRSILVRVWARNLMGCSTLQAWQSHLTTHLLSQLTSQDKAPSVVQRALQKHNVAQPWARDYQLFQVLPGDRGEQGLLGCWARGLARRAAD